MAEIANNELSKGIYREEDDSIDTLRQQKWFKAHKLIIVLRAVQLLKWIFVFCFILVYFVSPFVNLGVSVWRLVRRDYGDAGGGDIANRAKLNAALDIFYALILFQSLFAFYYLVISWVRDRLVSRTKEHCGLGGWHSALVRIYYKETQRKFNKDGELPDNWNLITFGVELLQSASGDDHLRGERILDQLVDKDASVRMELLSSRLSIQNLIGMISLRGTAYNIMKIRFAARIVAHLASDLNITHLPGTLQCICSLLGSCPSENPDEHRLADKKDQHGADTVLHIIKDKTGHESGGAKGLLILEKPTQDEENCTEISTHQRLLSKITSPLLISQGLQILEKLTQDEENCTEISKHQRLLSKITSPLSSPDFLSNVREDTMVGQMLSKSLTLVSRLLASPGDGATRLRQELASNTEAVSNLIAILETDSEGSQQLHQQALEILTELAFDDSFKKLDFNKLFKALIRIILEEEANNTVVEVEQADREKATRLRGKAGEALARLLPVRPARDDNVAGILSKQDAINLLTKVLDQILSSKMGTAAGAAIGDNEKQSDERKFMAAILSLAVVIRNVNVISKEDFARAIHEDAALVKKLAEILKVNNHSTAECLRVVKLTCQVAIAMIQAKPSCIQHFNEHKFKEALTVALETMSGIDGCMLFAGNDREVIKPARSLL